MHSDQQRLLYLKIRDVNNLSHKRFGQLLQDKGITPVQFGVLMNLQNDEAMTMTKLNKLVGCVPSNMTTLINRMIREDLVKTTKNPDDQRQTFVFLTKKGVALRESLSSLYSQFLEENYAALSSEEQETLLQLISKLERSLI